MGCGLVVNVAGTNGAAAWLPLHGATPPLTLVSGEEPLRCWCRPADMAVGAWNAPDWWWRSGWRETWNWNILGANWKFYQANVSEITIFEPTYIIIIDIQYAKLFNLWSWWWKIRYLNPRECKLAKSTRFRFSTNIAEWIMKVIIRVLRFNTDKWRPQ